MRALRSQGTHINRRTAISDVVAAVSPGPWIALTLVSGFTPQTFGYTPAYRALLGGELELSGIVAGTLGASSGVLIANLPTAMAPAQEVDVAAATSQNGVSSIRIRVLPTGTVTAVTDTNSHTWVSLDGIRFRIV